MIDTARADSAPCGCGSGLSAARCCSVSLGDLVTQPGLASLDRQEAWPADGLADDAISEGRQAAAVAAQAAEAFRGGDRIIAERLSLDALEAFPREPTALATLAELRLDTNKTEAALALLRRLAAIQPTNVWPANKLAMLELGRGNAGTAEVHARHAVRLAPENPQSHNLMGMVMTQMRRATMGEFHCRRALELSGKRIPLVLANLATNLTALGRIDEARTLYEEADTLAPNNRQTLSAWSRMEEADRKLDVALALLDRLDALAPDDIAVMLARAGIIGRQKRYDDAVELLNVTAARRSRPLRPMERLMRGRLLDRLGRYDEAWADFDAAKTRLRELTGQVYLEKEAAALAQQLRAFFVRDRLASLPRAGVRSDVAQPVFIVGFPRSGTTLVEQMLSASPMIAAGDELPLIHEIAATMPRLLNSPWDYPGALAELWMGDGRGGLDTLRDVYLQRVVQIGFLAAEDALFTDKMPLNEMHLGLIALLFPRAPLIHVVRHPLDIMVSAMSNAFNHGGYCVSALESAAKHLLLSADMVAHYRREMDLNYLEVRYEDIVAEQEATMRAVFNFVGASFDPNVLEFEKNNRYARTASYAQVSEPLYDRSRGRYQHYRKFLAPAEGILTPLIERLGYAVN